MLQKAVQSNLESEEDGEQAEEKGHGSETEYEQRLPPDTLDDQTLEGGQKERRRQC